MNKVSPASGHTHVIESQSMSICCIEFVVLTVHKVCLFLRFCVNIVMYLSLQ